MYIVLLIGLLVVQLIIEGVIHWGYSDNGGDSFGKRAARLILFVTLCPILAWLIWRAWAPYFK